MRGLGEGVGLDAQDLGTLSHSRLSLPHLPFLPSQVSL